jgi:predicted nucleic acid-binding protein
VILADTSAWVEYDRATGSTTHLRLRELITSEETVAVTEPIIIEMLAGARSNEREAELRRLLERFPLLLFDAASDFDGAATIYRRCRAEGVTPRGLLDCMVAAVAWRTSSTLLAHDADLDRVAGVMGIAMDRASLRTRDRTEAG